MTMIHVAGTASVTDVFSAHLVLSMVQVVSSIQGMNHGQASIRYTLLANWYNMHSSFVKLAYVLWLYIPPLRRFCCTEELLRRRARKRLEALAKGAAAPNSSASGCNAGSGIAGRVRATSMCQAEMTSSQPKPWAGRRSVSQGVCSSSTAASVQAAQHKAGRSGSSRQSSSCPGGVGGGTRRKSSHVKGATEVGDGRDVGVNGSGAGGRISWVGSPSDRALMMPLQVSMFLGKAVYKPGTSSSRRM